MVPPRSTDQPGWVLSQLLEHQCGVVTSAQARAAGLSRATVRAHLDAGRWQRVHGRVYAAFAGPLPRRSELWAAVLLAGPGAMLSHTSAAELVGLCDPVRPVHLTVPGSRRVEAPDGVVIHYRQGAADRVHPGRTPPQTRVEHTIVDLTQSAASLGEAIEWVTKACAKRVTTVRRLTEVVTLRRRLRWRAELTEALADVGDGCHSVLERWYRRDVERAHALPPARRQVARRTAAGVRYDDARYDRYRLVIELDGKAAHPDASRWRDRYRDNVAVAAGFRVMRYGWADVSARPCAVAAQAAGALAAGGWRGHPRRCARADCVIR